MKKLLALTISLMLAAALSACGSTSAPAEPADDTGASLPEGSSNHFTSHYEIADTLYNNKNQVFSQLSLNMLMAMLEAGAHGSTLQKLTDFTGLDADKGAQLALELSSYYDSLKNVEVSMANGVWADSETLQLNDSYREIIEEAFSGSVDSYDFKDPKTAELINKWCADNTNGHIDNLFDAHTLAGASCVLANALYFNGTWERSYDDSQLDKNAVFHNMDGSEAKVTMLHSTEEIYLENQKAEGVMKPYGDNTYFVGILPKKEGEFTMAELDIDGLLDSAAENCQVEAAIPEFKVETASDLKKPLSELGLEELFDPLGGGLSGIGSNADGSSLFIDLIKQKAMVQVSKEGTEAAAVTGGIMDMTSLPPEDVQVKTVTLDRPFAFLIYDDSNDTVLFQGKIVSGADN